MDPCYRATSGDQATLSAASAEEPPLPRFAERLCSKRRKGSRIESHRFSRRPPISKSEISQDDSFTGMNHTVSLGLFGISSIAKRSSFSMKDPRVLEKALEKHATKNNPPAIASRMDCFHASPGSKSPRSC